MVLTKFQDKALSGLLVGMTMMKLYNKEITIPRKFKRKINAIKLDFLILKNFGKDDTMINFMWKDSDDKDSHFHFFPTDDQIGLGLVVTDETKVKPYRNIPVDNKKFFEVFGKELVDYFNNEKEILNIDTSKFNKSRIITYKPTVSFSEPRGKMLNISLEENEKEITINEFKKIENPFAVVINEQGNVDEFIVKKDNKIYCFNYKSIRKIGLELFPILQENYKGSDKKI